MFQTVTEGLQSLYTKKLLPLEQTYLFNEFHSPALEPADFNNKPMVLLVGQEHGGRNAEGEMFQTVTEGLQSLYTKKLLPLEQTYLFNDFHSPALEPADFNNKPMVLLVGQYSTGKTTFIREHGGRNAEGEMFQTVTEGLQSLYTKKLLPLEQTYLFNDFHSPALEPADFNNKPMVLLVGQYSTGKTTFIRYLLEQDFPGMRIGPEPTTDSFIAVMHGETEGVIPGNALVVDPNKPFRKLNSFGNAFLNRFVCSQMPNQVLQSISVIDTPGILSGEKQRISRGGSARWACRATDTPRQ
ncbi:UNVERIFIED_CONTAM: hypothetical protein FKN15_056012 [Acipenser sinensis]